MAKTEETPTIRRSTYVEPSNTAPSNTAPLTMPSEELKETIAAARAGQVAELKEQLEEAQKLAAARLEVIENMSVELAELQESIKELAEAKENEPAPVSGFFEEARALLELHDAGPQAILAQMENRGPVSRAGFLASIEALAQAMQENTNKLSALHDRARVAERLVS